MSKRICGKCKSTKVVEHGYYAGSTFYKCLTCGAIERSDYFPKQALFNRITTSPEMLAQEFCDTMFSCSDNAFLWYSMLTGEFYSTKPEAIAATVARLKEVEK